MSGVNNINDPYSDDVEESYYFQKSNLDMPLQQPNNSIKYSSKEIYNSRPMDSIISQTKVFMKDIDISCDDHRIHHNAAVVAVRYCSRCKALCCDECIVDYHRDHISEAILKLNEYFSSKRKELEDIKNTIYSHIENKSFLEEVNERKDQIIIKTNNYFQRKSNEIDIIIAKLETIKQEQKKIKENTIANVEAFFIEECYNRMEKPLSNLKECKLLIFFIIYNI